MDFADRGKLVSAVAAFLLASVVWPVIAQGTMIYTVNNLGDSGCGASAPGTLRRAIEQANADGQESIIQFTVSGIITVSGCELPPLTADSTRIHGETSPGRIKVESGFGTVGPWSGFRIQADACEIRGIDLNLWDQAILVDGGVGSARYNRIGGVPASQRNEITNGIDGIILIGPDARNNTLLNNRINANQGSGIVLEDGASHNAVGAALDGWRNVITLSGTYGIRMYGGARVVRENHIEGNRVGTDLAGTSSGLGNPYCGISADGDSAIANVINENQVCDNGIGILVSSFADSNVVLDNYVGVDVAGTSSIGNDVGIQIDDSATENSVLGNLTSGNLALGILVKNVGTDRNLVAGNLVGVAADGTTPLPNGGEGVVIEFGAEQNEVRGNVVSANVSHGVVVQNFARDNLVEQNHIGTDAGNTLALGNGGHGILADLSAAANRFHGNVILDHDVTAVFITAGCDSHVVTANYIGKTAVPNERGVDVHSSYNRIGGSRALNLGNEIVGNNQSGIVLRDTTSLVTGNTVQGNTINENGGHGIVLGDFAVGNLVGAAVSVDSTQDLANTLWTNAGSGIRCGETGSTVDPKNNRFLSNSITGNGSGGISLFHSSPAGNNGIPAPAIVLATTSQVAVNTNMSVFPTKLQIFTSPDCQGKTLLAEYDVPAGGGPLVSVPVSGVAAGDTITVTNTGPWPTAMSLVHTSEFSLCDTARADTATVVHAGLPHTALGGAVLNPMGGGLEVSSIGSSGEDGVAIDLGESEGSLITLTGLGMPGCSTVNLAIIGLGLMAADLTVGPPGGALAGTCPYDSCSEASLDVSPLGALAVGGEAYYADELIYTWSGVASGAPFAQFGGKGDYTFEARTDEMTGIKVGLSFPQGAHMVTFPGGPTLMVDGMVVYPVPPMVPPDVITRAELRIAGCPTETVVLTDEALRMFGTWYRALGEAQITGLDGESMGILNIGKSAIDGVTGTVTPDHPSSRVAAWTGLTPGGATPESADVYIEPRGVISGSLAQILIGHIEARYDSPDIYPVVADFSALGATSMLIEVLDGSTVVYSMGGQMMGDGMRADVWPTSFEYDAAGRLVASYPTGTMFSGIIPRDPGRQTPAGGPAIGDGVRFTPEDPTSTVDEVLEIELGMRCFGPVTLIEGVPSIATTVPGSGLEVLQPLALSPLTPNPFRDAVSLRFRLGSPAPVTATVYNPLGRRVRLLLAHELRTSGTHLVVWDGRDDGGRPAASGVYFFRLQAGSVKSTARGILIR